MINFFENQINKVYYFNGIPAQILGYNIHFALTASIKPINIHKLVFNNIYPDYSLLPLYNNSIENLEYLYRKYSLTANWPKLNQFNCGFVPFPEKTFSNINTDECLDQQILDHFQV